MIETIKGIKINGRCFKTDTSLLFYQKPNDRISIVYGKNGSGKSTISEGIASLSHKGIPSDLTTSFVDSNQQSLPLGDDTNGRVYCKYLVHKDEKVYLCSFNSSYPPIEISPDDELIVYGAVVEVET